MADRGSEGSAHLLGAVNEPLHIVACAALVREFRAVLAQLPDGADVDIAYLPASLHNTPDRIVEAVRDAIDSRSLQGGRTLIGYADCGTGGGLDQFCQSRGFERLPGAHCYELLAGSELFAHLADQEPGTFYLTDFLARHFDALVIAGLGLDRHPELEPMYFGHYRRLVLITQSEDPDVVYRGQAAAQRLDLEFVHVHVGRSHLASVVHGSPVSLGGRRS